MELEVNKVNSETRAVLFDIQDTTDVMEGEFSEELLGLSSGEEKNGNGGGGSGSGKRGMQTCALCLMNCCFLHRRACLQRDSK